MSTLATVLVGLDAKDEGLDRGFDSIGRKASSLGSVIGKAVAAGAVVATTAIVGLTVKGLQEFTKFDQGMREVFTLMPGISGRAMGEMTQQVKDFSVEFGVLPEKTIPALYQAISAGVPRENVFSFLETAQKAAAGGVTELETAVDGISSVINAYGTDVLSAAEASDLMFTAVRLGKTTFGELAQSLFNVVPVAAALGVEFGDVTAALATMTAQGVPTSVATTQLRQMFVELSKAGGDVDKVFRDIAGMGFKEFIAEGNNVQDALLLLEDHAKDTGVGLNDLFGSVEAGTAALALTGKATETYRKAIEEMGSSAGATEAAYETMAGSIQTSLDKLKAAWDVILITVGEQFAPVFQDSVDSIVDNMPAIQSKIVGAMDKIGESVGRARDWVGGLVGDFMRLKDTQGWGAAIEGLFTKVTDKLSGWLSGGGAEAISTAVSLVIQSTVERIPQLAIGLVKGLINGLFGTELGSSGVWQQAGAAVAEGLITGLKTSIGQIGVSLAKAFLDVVEGDTASDQVALLAFKGQFALEKGYLPTDEQAVVIAEAWGVIGAESALAFTAAAQSGLQAGTPQFTDYIENTLGPAGSEALVRIADKHGLAYAYEIAGAIGRGEVTVLEAIEFSMRNGGTVGGEAFMDAFGGAVVDLPRDLEQIIRTTDAVGIAGMQGLGYLTEFGRVTVPLPSELEAKLDAAGVFDIAAHQGKIYIDEFGVATIPLANGIEVKLRDIDTLGIGDVKGGDFVHGAGRHTNSLGEVIAKGLTAVDYYSHGQTIGTQVRRGFYSVVGSGLTVSVRSSYSGGRIPMYDTGGPVPGSGPQPAIVHGGEYVLTQGDTGLMKQLIAAINNRGSGGITVGDITVNGGRTEAEEAVSTLTTRLQALGATR